VTVFLLWATWETIFAAIAVSAALVTVVLYRVARRAELPDASGADRDLLGAARSQWPLVAVSVITLGATGFVWQGVFNFYVSYLVETRGFAESAARNRLTVVFVAGLPAFFVSGRLIDRLPRVPYLLSILVAFVVVVLSVTVAQGVALVAATAALGYVIHSLFPAIDAFLLGTLPDEHRGGAYAVYSGGMMLVQSTGSSAVGLLVGAGFAYDAVFRGLAGGLSVVVLGLCGLWLVGRFPGATRTAAPDPVT
jgi:predicted MFS family arabinose efflux permease